MSVSGLRILKGGRCSARAHVSRWRYRTRSTARPRGGSRDAPRIREVGLLTLEAAVHKAAYRPAEKLGFRSKGRVQVGADADLVVLDPATVRDLATYADPHRFPAGIEHVVVAGGVTVRGGRHTGARAGRVLRRP